MNILNLFAVSWTNVEKSKMSTSKIEFAVQMTCDSCVEAVEHCLKNVDGVKSVDIDLKAGSVVVDSNLSTLDLQKRLESTGRKVAVKGHAGTIAAVSILETGDTNVHGVVRFMQVTPNVCIIDGTVDGLKPGPYQISVHECGDLSEGCESVGDVYNPTNTEDKRKYGDLGIVTAAGNGLATFRFEDNVINLADIIGRSFVIAEKGEGTGKAQQISAGIIARSAGLFQNPKTICACDGVTIWDEVSKTKANL